MRVSIAVLATAAAVALGLAVSEARGFLARFTVRSEFGALEAAGIHMLHVRLRETHALGELETMSKTKEFETRGWTVQESFSVGAER